MRESAIVRNAVSVVLLALAGALLIPAAGAQATWLVGPTQAYSQIRDVMPLVAPGDHVVVEPGTYFDFRCDRAVTIRAQTPGTVVVAFHWEGLPASCGCACLSQSFATRLDPPAGSDLHVVGIEFEGFYSITPCFTFIRHRVEVGSGRVTFDQCRIDALRVQSASVRLQDCDVTSGFRDPGLTAEQADITVVGGTISGADVGTHSASPQPAVSMQAGSLHASGVTLRAGDQGATALPAAALSASGGSVWLSDSTAIGTQTCAIEASGVLRIDRSTLTNVGSGCVSSPLGGPLIGIARNGAIRNGSQFQATLKGDPGDLQIFYGSTGLGDALLVPLLQQPVWIDVSGLFLALPAVAGSTGETVLSYVVPAVPALVGASFWLQGVGGASFPLAATPVVGGVVQ